MPVTKDQAHMLASLAVAVRAETQGAGEWDAPGVVACIEAVRGMSLAEVMRSVARLAEDPAAKTPGGLRDTRNPCWRERSTQPGTPLPPKREEACFDCGRYVGACVCNADPDEPRGPTTRAPGKNPRNAEHAKAARELLEAGRTLASQREDLIAAGVDPAELEIPLAPEETP